MTHTETHTKRANTNTHTSMRTRKQGGFGLAEAIVAVAIFTIVMASVAPVLMTLVRTNQRNEQRAEAGYAAQRVFDELRQQNFGDWPNSGTTGTVDTGQGVYDYELTYCTNGSDQFCSTNVRQARVEISRNEQRAEAGYAAQRVLDEMRQLDFPSWPASGTTGTVDTGQTVYDYELTYCANGSDQFCRTNVRQARVEISRNGEMLYGVEVVYTSELGNKNRNITPSD